MRRTCYSAIPLTVLLICLVTGPIASGTNEEFKVTEVFLKRTTEGQVVRVLCAWFSGATSQPMVQAESNTHLHAVMEQTVLFTSWNLSEPVRRP